MKKKRVKNIPPDQSAEVKEIKRPGLIVYAVLAILTLIIYQHILYSDFINFDDDVYVYNNDIVKAGLSLKGLGWAFGFHAANWHPLTWVSHMLDCSIYGLSPTGHHLTNLIFHIINTLLLLFVLNKMTGSVWRSAFVAALFAIHPLHVESVAWTAERKDLLSTFFWLMTILTYTYYAKAPCIKRYILVFVMLVLGLMSKPMLVTLPLILLILDFWPLGRMKKTSFGKLIAEKIPLFLLVIGASIITFLVQDDARAVWDIPLSLRIENSIVSYVEYLIKTFWPVKLGLLYPFPEKGIALWKTIGSAILLLGITAAAFKLSKKKPYLIAGWLWFGITLVPVIGIVQVGYRSMADRYTYIPLTGIFIIIAWLVRDIDKIPRRVLQAAAGIVIITLSVSTWIQTGYWKNCETLYMHTIKVTPPNMHIHNNLSTYLFFKKGDIDGAIYHMKEAVRINDDDPPAIFNAANTFLLFGRNDDAIEQFEKYIKLVPKDSEGRFNLAQLLVSKGKYEEAAVHLKEAAYYDPGIRDRCIMALQKALNNGLYDKGWEQVRLMRSAEFEVPAGLLKELSDKMPEPKT